MFIIVFEAWNGIRSEIYYNEKDAKERYLNLKEFYTKVHLLKVVEQIVKVGGKFNEM